jgi:hypothetical protein
MQVKSHDLVRGVGAGLSTAELALSVIDLTIAELSCRVHDSIWRQYLLVCRWVDPKCQSQAAPT